MPVASLRDGGVQARGRLRDANAAWKRGDGMAEVLWLDSDVTRTPAAALTSPCNLPLSPAP